MEYFSYILILLGCSVVLIVFCRRLHLPPIIGYLFVGIIVGPGGLHWLPTIENLQFLAEFGVVFLMFTLGLEFSIPRLISARRILLSVGGLQVLMTTVVVTLIGWYFDIGLKQSVVIGGALALSSTAVVIKQLTEQKEQHSNHGHMAINILLFQDIAAVLFLILIPAMAGDDTNPLHITFLLTIGKGVGVCVAMAFIGLWFLRPLFHEVAKAHSTELFMIATLLVALSAAGITHYLGLSMALGAFLAGMVLGETEFRHQIELDIRPFRDVLLGLFFVIIGAYLELDQLPNIWLNVIILVLSIISGKALIIMLTARLFGQATKETAIKTAIVLAHGGEFSFVVLTVAIASNIVNPDQRPAIFAAVVVSVLLAPLLIRFNGKICGLFLRDKLKEIKTPSPHKIIEHAAELKNHVVLCGFGRVGQILARFLDQENIPWLALDLDPMRLSKSSIAGENSFFGDATHPSTLAASGLSRARMVVISFSNETEALEVLRHVRAMRLDVPVFVRTKDDNNLDAFQKAGATEVVPESLEGSIMLASHLLLTLGVPTSKVINMVRRVHYDRYEMIRGIYKGTDDSSVLEEKDSSRRSLHSIYITDNSNAINKTLGDICPKDSTVTARSVTRQGKRHANPQPDMILQAEDVLVILSTPEESVIIEEKILRGS